MDENKLKDNLINSRDETHKRYNNSIQLDYDYEKNSNIDNEDFNKESFNDSLADKFYRCEQVTCFKKNFLKRLVSKKKIRLINNNFDLDLIYITKRVMAMGYPSVSYESLYRNSLKEVKRFFKFYHNNKVKIYNLCIEEERIYDKQIFDGMKVGLFPSADHSSCPIKMIFEFCVDVCINLTRNEDQVAAVHCKAGKGRTGVMISCYLIFSGICDNANLAMEEYAERRSYIKKGVTIPSQKRYIHHFETYLSCNFVKPYYKLIPKIVKNYLTPSTNLLINVLKDKSFHEYINVFNLKKIKIGPFINKPNLYFIIKNFHNQIKFDSKDKFEKINFKYCIKDEINSKTGEALSYSILEFNQDFQIECDVNLLIKGKGFTCNTWLNLFFITLEYYFLKIEEFSINNNSFLPLSPTNKRDGEIFATESKDFKDGFKQFKHSDLFEMKDLSKMLKRQFIIESPEKTNKEFSPIKSKLENPNIKQQGKLNFLFIIAYDINRLVKNNKFENFEKLIIFLRCHADFKNENILKYDLNNIANYLLKKISDNTETNNKTFKFFTGAYGLDKFPQKNKMHSRFGVEITYELI